MKISDINYRAISEVDQMPRFDLTKQPRKAKWYLQLLAWVLSFPETFIVKAKIKKIRMKGLKGPYILLCNHNSFLDFKVATRAIFPRRANYIVAIDGFIFRENLLRDVGCIGNRKFVSDSSLIRRIKYSLEELKLICEIYPEARYSLIGTSSILPKSLGKMFKKFGLPVVTLISHGHHLRQPVWNLEKRKVRTKTEMTQLFTKDELRSLSIDEINKQLNVAFKYDDYAYQLEENIKINYKDRAKNLHKVLYMCPSCNTEFQMKSDGNRIWCNNCGEIHEMDDLGRLHSLNSETKHSHIPDWFEWQRQKVKEELQSGKYHIEIEVEIDSLPNSTGYYRLGKGKLIHDMTGFHLSASIGDESLSVDKTVLANYGVHVEFDYFEKGDCVSFSNTNDTYYLYPTDKEFAVTKLHFAVEELYKLKTNDNN